ncbi:MAG: hypothetical protein JSS86_15460 [Cyanobacteria bacterium SZAS LIN-2]|nr:hypothetical protein [Cyanobacteria bacterium SZAS LIN-2]
MTEALARPLKVFIAQILICLTISLSVAGSTAPVLAQAAASANNQALVKLEKKFFEHTYPSDSDDDRIGRLEKLIFGETKSGDPQSRLAEIQKIVATNDIPSDSSSGSSSDSSSSTASSSGQSSAGQGNSGSTPTTASTASSAAVPGASYPRVDALEELLLGQTYKSTALEKRLGQLEKKAFGRPSTSDDMSARTDALEQYWQKSLSPALNQKYDRALTQLESQVIGQSYPDKPIIERLQTLEGIVFPNDPPDTHSSIKDQLETLANAVQISQKQGRRPTASAGDQGQPAPQSYAQQQAAMNNAPGQYGSYSQSNPYNSGSSAASGSYGSQMGYSGAGYGGTSGSTYGAQTGYANTDHTYPGQPAANSYTSNGQYTTSQVPSSQPSNYGQITPFTNSAANNESYGSNSTNQNGSEPNKGHPLLKGLAKALGAAAGLAAGAVGSGMMYGGGYGGYGYGGYPMGGYGGYGYGGYPMGGYGGYGGYPMGGININGMGGYGGSSLGRWW